MSLKCLMQKTCSTYSYVSFRLLTGKKVPGYLGIPPLAGRFYGHGTRVLSENFWWANFGTQRPVPGSTYYVLPPVTNQAKYPVIRRIFFWKEIFHVVAPIVSKWANHKKGSAVVSLYDLVI